METKVKIFICTHKNFKVPEDLSPELYSIITNGCDIDTKSPFETIIVPESYKNALNGYDDKVYSEMYMIRYLYDHQELLTTPTTKVVGFLGQARSCLPL